MSDVAKIASDVLELVGGKENVRFVNHCITRLRFNLVDQSKADTEAIKKIKGIIGVNTVGDQYQVIVGPLVDQVYGALCELGGFEKTAAVDADDEKKPFSLKNLGSDIMDYLSGSLTPAIPVMLAGAMIKMVLALFGPDMLGIMSTESDLYTLFTFVGDAAYYFFPIYIGFSAAKKLGANQLMGAFMGGILLHPTVASLADTGFKVYGIPAAMQSYSATVLPILLIVYVMSLVEKFFKKFIPATLRVMGVPLMTTLVMLPLALCVLGPIGGFLGNYICNGIIWIGNVLGPIGPMVIGALWEFLVMTGMHQVMISQMVIVFVQNGFENVVSLGATAASLAVSGMCLGVMLAQKNKENKAESFTYFVSGLVGGVTEPGLYGNGIKYSKPLIGMMAGGAAGALYASIMGVKAYALIPVANFLALTSFAGGSTANLINGILCGVISLVVAAVVTYIICRKDPKIDE